MNPVTLTEAAVSHIQSLLAQKPNAIGFRLSVKKTGCSGYSYAPELVETVRAEDIHFTTQNNLAVYIDPNALPYLKNITIDFVAENVMGLKQKRLVFQNPNEKGRCGCGESFHVDE